MSLFQMIYLFINIDYCSVVSLGVPKRIFNNFIFKIYVVINKKYNKHQGGGEVKVNFECCGHKSEINT